MSKFYQIIITIKYIFNFFQDIVKQYKDFNAKKVLKKDQQKSDDEIDVAVKNKDIDKLNELLK